MLHRIPNKYGQITVALHFIHHALDREYDNESRLNEQGEL
jgi:hypothetical protein